MRDLVQATGVTPRVVRFYVACGILPPPEGRGTGPLYTEEHLLRLRAARRLRGQRLSIDAIRARLARLPPDELARLGAPPAPAAAGPPAGPATAPAARAHPTERWERATLLPGLELHVRGDASPLVRRIADEIHARYSAAAGEATALLARAQP